MVTEVGADGGVGNDPGQVSLGLHLLEHATLVHPHRDPPLLVGSVPQTPGLQLGILAGFHQLPPPRSELVGDKAVEMVVHQLPRFPVLAGFEGVREEVPGRVGVPVDDSHDVGGVGPLPLPDGMAGDHVLQVKLD